MDDLAVRPMTLQYLRETERPAALATTRTIPGAVRGMPLAADALLRLPCSLMLPASLSDGYILPQQALVSAGHTATVASNLWLRAHYVEAATLVRQLFEILVRLRYFRRHPEKARGYVLNHARRAGQLLTQDEAAVAKDVKFKAMFDDVAPGFYQPHYGVMLSDISHGGLAVAGYFRGKADPATHAVQPVFGSVFDEVHAGLLLRYWALAVYGLLQFALELDPDAKRRGDATNQAAIGGGLDWLARFVQNDWDENRGKLRELLTVAAPLIGWAAPK